MSASAPFHGLSCALLRGEAAGWPCGENERQVSRFLSYLDAQGIQPLVQFKLASSPSYSGWPRQLRLRLDGAAKLYGEIESRRALEVKKVVDALSQAQIVPLLLKGTPLAYSLYPVPHLRARADTDLLLPAAEVRKAHVLMESLGYRCQPLKNRKYSNFQFEAKKSTSGGLENRFDLHWKISNRMVLASALGYQELLDASIVIDLLGPNARMPAIEHSLLISCLHRAGEFHAARNKLIGLYDIHRLLESIPAEVFETTMEFALERRVGAVLLDGCQAARTAFGATVHGALLERFARELQTSPSEPSAQLLSPSLRGYQARLLEMQTLKGWQKRLDFLRETLSSPIRERLDTLHGEHSLPGLRVYTGSLLRGVHKLFRRIS